MERIVLASASPRRQEFFRLLGLPFDCEPAMIDETPAPDLNPREAVEEIARRKADAVAEKARSVADAPRSNVASLCAITDSLHELAGSLHAIAELPHASADSIRAAADSLRANLKSLQAAANPAPADAGAARASSEALAGARWIFAADTAVVLDGEIFGAPGGREEAREMLARLSGREHEVITAMALFDLRAGKADCRSVASVVEFAELSREEIEWYIDTGEWQGAAGGYRLQEKGACLVKLVAGSPSAVAGLPLHELYVMLRDNGYPFGA